MAVVDQYGNTYIPNMSYAHGHIILCHDLYSVCTVDLITKTVNLFENGGFTFVDLQTCLGHSQYK